MRLASRTLPSPLGELLLVTDERGVVRSLGLARSRARVELGPDPWAVQAKLRRYFDGEIDALADVAVEAHGSPLEDRVWAELRRIPVGTTASYVAIARRLGLADPRAAIDVGRACGRNPVAIIVPCHRVIGANGDLVGFGLGLDRKRRLLEHEGVPVGRGETLRLPGVG